MFCPSCGSKNSTNQKFCRSCGLSLEKIAQSLVEQLPVKSEESIEKRRDKIEKLGVIALGSFGVIGLGFLFYQIIFKMILEQGKLLPGIALLILFICGLLAVVFFNYANSLKDAATKRRLQQPTELPQGEASAKFLNEPYLEPIPSVTERTTELLYAEKKGNDKAS